MDFVTPSHMATVLIGRGYRPVNVFNLVEYQFGKGRSPSLAVLQAMDAKARAKVARAGRRGGCAKSDGVQETAHSYATAMRLASERFLAAILAARA